MANRSDMTEEVVEARSRAEDIVESDGRGTGQHTRQVEDRARRIEAVSLRLAGFTYDQIAARFECSVSAARTLVETTLTRAENLAVDTMRELENSRLDRLQAAIWSRALEGDLKAVTTVLNIVKERAKINGLYAPTKIDMNVGVRQEMELALADLEHLVTQQANAVARQEAIIDDRDYT